MIRVNVPLTVRPHVRGKPSAEPWLRRRPAYGLGGGRRRRLGIGVADGLKIEMPAFYRIHEAALAQPMLPQSEQVWVGLPLTTAERRQGFKTIGRSRPP